MAVCIYIYEESYIHFLINTRIRHFSNSCRRYIDLQLAVEYGKLELIIMLIINNIDMREGKKLYVKVNFLMLLFLMNFEAKV